MVARDIDALRKVHNFLISEGLFKRKANYFKKEEKILMENGDIG